MQTTQRSALESEENVIVVRDTGIGVELAMMAVIFEPSFTTSGQGTSIGLSFCKMAMESLGGAVDCISDGRTLTEFRLSFPRLCCRRTKAEVDEFNHLAFQQLDL